MKMLSIFYHIILLLLSMGYPHVAYAQNTDRVVYSVEHDGGLQILELATGDSKAMDVGMLNVGDLAYNRKRHLLAFEGSKEHDTPPAIYTYDFKMKKIEMIYTPSFADILYRPEFEPSGEYLFSLNYETGIFRYSFGNKKWEKVKVLGSKETNFQEISISQSGKKVALSPARFNGILLGDLNKSEIRIYKHILTDFDSCISPKWIDENTIVFLGRKKEGYQYLWKLSLITGIIEQLTSEPLGTRDYLDISDDNETIVFTATDSQFWRLWKININGEGLEPLTKSGQGHLSPKWTR